MKRQSFKYIFFLNLIFIAVCTVITFFYRQDTNTVVPASITTPIIGNAFEVQPFCNGASAAIIIDGKSGAVLYQKNALVRLPMASTTKIMTALTVLTYCDTSQIITVSQEAAAVEGSSIYLKPGEEISVLDLLYGLMLESGNDAASALATGCFDSEKECVDKMNSLCRTLGLIDTHFDNPHGLDSENHYTTAYELARITAAALENPQFRQIVSTKNYTATTGSAPRYFSNHNKLLRTYDGAMGVKTGYTSKSGRCLVTAAEKDGELYIAVTLNDKNDWNDHAMMLDFAFETFSTREIAKKNEFIIYNGFEQYVPYEDIFLTVKGDDELLIDYKVIFSEKSAECQYYYNGGKLGSFALATASGVSQNPRN